MITMQTPVRIEVEYWNLLPAVHLHATLHIYNDQGILAFTTGPAMEVQDPVIYVHPPAGLFRSVCHIPGSLLNSGSYRMLIYYWYGLGSDTDIYQMSEAIRI